MKHILILLPFIFHGQLMSQNTETVIISSLLDDFEIVSNDENKYTIYSGDLDYYYSNDPDLPSIPIKSISVLVPNGAEIVGHSFSIKKIPVSSDIDIDRSPVVLSTETTLHSKQSGFSFRGLYPEKPIQFSSVSVQRGFTQFNFSFSPFIYNGANKTLDFITQLNLIVSYRINALKHSSVHPDADLMQAIEQGIENPKAMDRLYNKSALKNNKTTNEKIDYLIVTNNILQESFTPLVQWKNRKGLNTKIVTIEEIYEKYDDPTIQLKIKRCLLDYYQNNDLKWVLLGGDIDVVPVQYCHNILEKGENENTSIPTDLFYACLDSRFDWNSYKDDIIGQLFWDGHDVTPEVYLTRLPVNTKEDADAFVAKTLEYETNPSVSNDIGKIIFAGVKLWSVWKGKSDSHHRSEYIYNKYVKNNTTGDNIFFFDTGTDFNSGADYDLTSINLLNKLNDGFGLLHFTGHGNYQSIAMESGNMFNKKDVFELNNQVGGIILTNACSTNAFDLVEPSFSEALIRHPKGGCVAYFGSSRGGFGNPDSTRELGASLRYNAKFIERVFRNKQSGSMTFGELVTFTKNDFVDTGLSNKYFSYLLYAINPIGDPELPLYNGKPKIFRNIRIFELGNSLYVNTGGVANGRICITSLNLNDGYKSLAENVSFHRFEDLPQQYQITITAPNYKPYTYVSGLVSNQTLNISDSFNVFPNPVKDIVHVDFSLPEGRLKIYDINGKLLKEMIIKSGTSDINISDLPEGFLILNFLVDDGVARIKIVKQN